ncbi:uncharacterized protein MELLADRAFT_59286 [Melampsora larici-populina 98AG31]|uniref:Uncharacterized protein n=1 Tax=Melampsora larici-populina (strain 98AG31 / pathotype 3-4-7) TaxID=747676 RepID=F4R5Q4_MELLP|nr:uncharacterized protein MELLADRAFT_59286 [Melampsora larici-populina 98AG31]EGG12220.1 hypothetical protein MELLADRAFT_59286 [Melampsora larici-populina 98AG31]
MVTLAEELAQSRRLAEIALRKGESGPSTRNRSQNCEETGTNDQEHVDYTHVEEEDPDEDDPRNDFNDPLDDEEDNVSDASAISARTSQKRFLPDGVERLPRSDPTEDGVQSEVVINARRDLDQGKIIDYSHEQSHCPNPHSPYPLPSPNPLSNPSVLPKNS